MSGMWSNFGKRTKQKDTPSTAKEPEKLVPADGKLSFQEELGKKLQVTRSGSDNSGKKSLSPIFPSRSPREEQPQGELQGRGRPPKPNVRGGGRGRPSPRQRGARPSSTGGIQANFPPKHPVRGIGRRPDSGPSLSTTGNVQVRGNLRSKSPVPRVPSPRVPQANRNPEELIRAAWKALRSENEQELSELLEHIPEFVNCQDMDGDTPLSFAALNKNWKLAKILLTNGAEASRPTRKGPEPIHIACENGDVEMASLLIKYNASVHSRNMHTDKSTLHYAAASRSVKIVEWLLANGADAACRNRMGISPVNVAVSNGSEAIVRALLQHKLDPNSPIDGSTLLHEALSAGYFRIACLLIRNGADIDATNKNGKRPLEVMRVNPLVNDADEFTGEGNSPIEGFLRYLFLFSCSTNNPTYVRAILRDAPQQFALQRSSQSYCSISPLSEAVSTIGAFDVATCLIEHGAPVKIPEENLPRGIFETGHVPLIRATCLALLGKKKKKLDLSHCNLHCLPEKLVELLATSDAFKQIKTLDLSHNTLRGLPPNLLRMTNLDKLKLEGNALDMIPESVRKNLSWVKVREYLKTVRERAQNWKACKLLVVGQEGVGKTTLVRALQSKNGKTQCKQNIATDGIEIKSVDIHSTTTDNEEFKLFVWDLGGQAIFYPTHQFYLTPNSMYIIAFDMAKISNKKTLDASSFEEIESRISYWAHQIRELTRASSTSTMPPLFLVGTHADQVQTQPNQTKEDAIAAQIEILRIKFPKQRFPGIGGIFAVSCKNGDGISELRNSIIQSGKRKGFLPRVSESWVKLHDYVTSTTIIESETITRSVLNELARMCGVPEDEIPMACNFLCEMGSLLVFDGEGLENLVIMNPRWLTNVMSSLITFRHSWIKDGTLPLKDIQQVFKNYPTETHDTLLKLLEHFSIIYRISSNGKQEILVPSLLPEECRVDLLRKFWPIRQKTQTDEYGRLYRFPFLPLGFFGRLMVRVLHLPGVSGSLFWRYGMVAEYNDPTGNSLFSPTGVKVEQIPHLALLQYDPVLFQFSIRVRVPKTDFGKNMLLQTLVDCVDTTLEEYCLRECAERLIPCTHCIDADSTSLTSLGDTKNNIFLFSFAECVIAVTEQSGHVFCNHIRSPSRMVPVDRLAPDIGLSGIPLIDEKQLTILDTLGQGGFGTVYRAEFRPLTTAGRYEATNQRKTRKNRVQKVTKVQSTLVAVKELHCDDKFELALMYSDFQAEVFVMSQMKRHPNIVRLHGVCLFPKPRMVLELLPNGDLYGFLHPKHPQNNQMQTYITPSAFPWNLRLLIALDIAKGMFVLHSHSPSIIHRDLRSPNIFLHSLDENASVRAKVADFGLARIVAPTVSGTLTTWQWLAPEVLGMTANKGYGSPSDVYSYAICCWEIATGGFPFDEFNDDPRFSTNSEFSLNLLKEEIANDLRPTLLPGVDKESLVEGVNMPSDFRELIEECWATEPSIRPSFAEILDRLILMCTLTPKQKEAVVALRNSTKNSKAERTSCRLTIAFTPVALTNIFQQSAGAVQYHTEYKSTQKYSLPLDSIPVCGSFIDNGKTGNSSFWLGFLNGKLCMTTITNTNTTSCQILANFDRPILTPLQVDQKTVWVCGKDGKLMIWDAVTSEIIREWNLRKSVAIAMILVTVAATGVQQVWIASPHCIHIYVDGQLLHILNTTKKQEITALAQNENFVWVSVGNEIYAYDIETLDLAGSWEAHESPVSVILYLSNGIVWTASKREIGVWQTNNMEIFCKKKLALDGDCKDLFFSNVCNRVWALIDDNIIIWDPLNFQPLQEIVPDTGDGWVSVLGSNSTEIFSLSLRGVLSSWKRINN